MRFPDLMREDAYPNLFVHHLVFVAEQLRHVLVGINGMKMKVRMLTLYQPEISLSGRLGGDQGGIEPDADDDDDDEDGDDDDDNKVDDDDNDADADNDDDG